MKLGIATLSALLLATSAMGQLRKGAEADVAATAKPATTLDDARAAWNTAQAVRGPVAATPVAPAVAQPAVQAQGAQAAVAPAVNGAQAAVAPKVGGAVAPVAGAAPAGVWYEKDATGNQNPQNIVGDGKAFTMTVKPTENSCKLSSTQAYTQGRFEIKMKSAAVMPGIITAVYLASGDGRTGDGATGNQDEIDWEIKGNEPTQVQTNVFLGGQESLKLIPLGGDSSQMAHDYAIQWDANTINFELDGAVVRTDAIPRPLAPMKISMSVWTTMGGWPGLKAWAGETNWDGAIKEATATFEVVSLPQ